MYGTEVTVPYLGGTTGSAGSDGFGTLQLPTTPLSIHTFSYMVAMAGPRRSAFSAEGGREAGRGGGGVSGGNASSTSTVGLAMQMLQNGFFQMCHSFPGQYFDEILS
jgi:hypothetical protein